MARNFTLIELITKGRRRCDQENRDLLSAAEWKEEASTVKAEFEGELMESGMRMFEKTDAISSVSGTQTYAVPADFNKMVGVDYLQSDGQRLELEPLLAQERNVFTGTTASGWSVAYELIGYDLKLWPTPAGSQTYYVVYVPQPTDVSNAPDSEVIDVVIPAGEQFFTWSLALAGAVKEESDQVPYIERKIEQYRQRLRTWATEREMYTPKRRFTHGSLNTASFAAEGGWLPGDWIRR